MLDQAVIISLSRQVCHCHHILLARKRTLLQYNRIHVDTIQASSIVLFSHTLTLKNNSSLKRLTIIGRTLGGGRDGSGNNLRYHTCNIVKISNQLSVCIVFLLFVVMTCGSWICFDPLYHTFQYNCRSLQLLWLASST
jgi:hypothetical protein